MIPVSAAILAGGKASRLNGINKSEIRVGTKRIIDIQISLLKDIFDEILLVSSSEAVFKELKTISDYYVDVGPIAGIHSALTHASNPSVFVFSSDMPFLNSLLIRTMLTKYLNSTADIMVPLNNHFIEPLHAIYSKSCLPVIEQSIHQKRYAIRAFFDHLNVFYWDLPETFKSDEVFFNINYPEDILKANLYANRMEQQSKGNIKKLPT